MISETLILNQANEIDFVMVDASLTEVHGLGAGFTLQIKKAGGGFVASAGVKSETAFGWYHYVFTPGECDTRGPMAVRVTGAGCIQQNLEYVVEQRNAGCREYEYIARNSVTLAVMPNVEIWITTDAAGANVIWNGMSDAFGVARDVSGNMPCLDTPNTYYFWKHRVGFVDDDNPDTEFVSPP